MKTRKSTRFFALLFTAALLLGTLALPASAAELPFTDVPDNVWYADAVKYAYENDLFKGEGNGQFNPTGPMTRGMFVQVLANKADNYNKADWAGKSSFSDVNKNIWYAAPVEWASKTGLVAGVGEGKFSPNANVTREQMAVIMYNYAKKTGNDTSFDNDVLSAFSDASKVSRWATEAMQWAVSHKIINGSGGKLDPAGNAQRCQVAQVMKSAAPALVKNQVEVPDTPDTPDNPGFVDPTPDDLPEGACTYQEFREIFSGEVTVVGIITYMASTRPNFYPPDVRAVDLTPFYVLKEYAIATMKELGLVGDTDKTLIFSFLGSELVLDYNAPVNIPNYYSPASFSFYKARLDLDY